MIMSFLLPEQFISSILSETSTKPEDTFQIYDFIFYEMMMPIIILTKTTQ